MVASRAVGLLRVACAAGASCTGTAAGAGGHGALEDWTEALGVPASLAAVGHGALDKVSQASAGLSKATQMLGHGVESLGASLSRKAMEERERAMEGLAQELEAVERSSQEEAAQLAASLAAMERT